MAIRIRRLHETADLSGHGGLLINRDFGFGRLGATDTERVDPAQRRKSLALRLVVVVASLSLAVTIMLAV